MDNQSDNMLPTQSNENTPSSKKKNNTWIYLGVIALLLITNGILFFNKKANIKKDNDALTIKDEAVVERDNLQQAYNASLYRLDSLTSENTVLSNQVQSQNDELSKTKARIQQILSNSNATKAELEEAKQLISSLNIKIASYENQILALKRENASLTNQKNNLTATNTSLNNTNIGLQHQVDLAKVLHVSNIRILGIDLRRQGSKEKAITKAKRIDVFRVMFDIDENRLTENGTQELYISIINPSGVMLSNLAMGSGSFTSAEHHNNVLYSLSKRVKLQTNQPLKDITVDWQQSTEYEKGAYSIKVYNQGYLIGQGSVTFR